MITILDGKLNIPEAERFIGFAGDNLNRTIKFLIDGSKVQSRIYRLYLTFDDGTCNYFTLPSELCDEGVFLTWQVEVAHIFKSGLVRAQIKGFNNNGVVYHTTPDTFIVGESAELSDSFLKENSEFLEYEKRLNELADAVSDVCVMMPIIGDNGNWYIYNASTGEYEDSGKSSIYEAETNEIADGAVNPSKLDRTYWEKSSDFKLTDISSAKSVLSGFLTDTQNRTASNTLCRLFSDGSIISEGICLGIADGDAAGMYIHNLNTGELYYYEKNTENFRKVSVGDIQYAGEFATTEELGSFDFTLQTIYEFNFTGTLAETVGTGTCTGFVRELNPNDLGYDPELNGLCKLIFTNLETGVSWSINLYGYYTPVRISAETDNGIIDIGNVNELTDLQEYDFEVERWYSFYSSAELGSLVGSGKCLGVYEVRTDGIDTVLFGMLKFINIETGVCWNLRLDTGEAEFADSLNLYARVTSLESRVDAVELNSWKDVQRIVRAGKAADYFSIGDQLVCSHSELGNLTWEVIGIDHDIPVDENYTHSMTLRMKPGIKTARVFDAPEAFAYVHTTTPTLSGAALGFTVDGTTLYVSAKTAMPAGAVIVFPYYNYETITDTPVYVYRSVTATEPMMTLSVTNNSGGPTLAGYVTFNDINRVRYGSNNWSQSAIRQYLNSSAEIGQVWTPQSNFDRPPEWASNTAGFLNGIDEDFLSVLGAVYKTTALPETDVTDEATIQTAETMFLLSSIEAYGNTPAGEGTAYAYYSENSDLSQPSNGSGDSNRIEYYNNTAQYSWLRSAATDSAYKVFYINTRGIITSRASSAEASTVVNPCCCIV